jgi:hypothetical protein
MKRLLTLMGIGTAAFLIVIASVKLGITQQEADAKLYLSQGLYDEAMQAYARSSLYGSILKGVLLLMGEFNATLSLFGFLFFGASLYLKKWQKKSPLKQVKITEEFK